MPDPLPADQHDAVIAAVDLIGRSGATDVECGYLHDGVPTPEAGWWAKAGYRGARLQVQDATSPVDALEQLAVRVLTGGQCAHCRALVCLDDAGAWAHDVTLADGRKWSAQDQAAAGLCHWRRVGPKWIRGCEDPAPPPGRDDRAGRRRAARAARAS